MYLKRKLIFCSYAVLRILVLYYLTNLFSLKLKILSRSTRVLPLFRLFNIYIYNGHKFLYRRFFKYSVGFCLGEFTWNRKITIFKRQQFLKKRKQLRKKEAAEKRRIEKLKFKKNFVIKTLTKEQKQQQKQQKKKQEERRRKFGAEKQKRMKKRAAKEFKRDRRKLLKIMPKGKVKIIRAAKKKKKNRWQLKNTID